MRSSVLLVVLAVWLPAQGIGAGDRVVLKSRRVLEGRLEGETPFRLWFHDHELGDLVVSRTRVRAVVRAGEEPGVYGPEMDAAAEAAVPVTYVRYVRPKKEKEGSLQTGLTRWFHPETRTTLFLVGVVHVGEEDYFRRLQVILDSTDVVLFEGVGRGSDEVSQADRESMDALFKLQLALKDILALDFQKDCMDYERPFWKNADVDMATLRKEMKTRKVRLPTESKLFRLLMKLALGFLNPEKIKEDPKLAMRIRRQTAGVMAMADKLMAKTGGLAKVLLDYRNEAAWQVLEKELAAGPEDRWLSLFYGAAHLPDFARRLKAEGWRCQGVDWLPAWTIR